MAEQRGSRRNTPQPVTDTTSNAEQSGTVRRSTRATRSQSRELTDSEGRDGPTARRNPQQSGAVEERAISRKGRLAKPLSEQQDLSTIIEGPSIAYPELPNERSSGAGETPRNAGQVLARDKQSLLSPGGASAFSGTTVRASKTAQELEDLVSEGLLDALPDLSSASDKLLGFLIPENLSEVTVNDLRQQLSSKTSRLHKNFQRLSKAFYVQREPFGNDSLIDLRRTLRALIDSNDLALSAAEPWRPDALLKKANLAALTAKVLASSDSSEAESFWEDLEQNFLRYFVGDRDDAQSPQIFQLTLGIRTQYTVTQLIQHVGEVDFDSDEILAQVFNGQGKSFRGWDFEGMSIDELSKTHQKSLVSRFTEFKEICQRASQSPAVSLELPAALRASFLWDSFSYMMVAWVKEKSEELQASINESGGAETILQSLSDEIQRRKNVQSPTHQVRDLQAKNDQVKLNYDTPSETSDASSAKARASNAQKKRMEDLKHGTFRIDSPKHLSLAAHVKRKAARQEYVEANAKDEPQLVQQDPSEVQLTTTAVAASHASPSHRNSQEPQQSSSTLPHSEGAPNARQTDDWQRQHNGDDEQDEDAFQVDDRRVEQVLAISAQQQAESNKENEIRPILLNHSGHKRRRLIDPQPNARRISPISQGFDQDDQQYDDSDLSQDEDFQQSHVPANASFTLIGRSSPKRKRRVADTSMTQHSLPRRASTRSRSRQSQESEQRVLQEQQIPLSQAQIYSNVNSVAKDRVADRSKAPQSRRPWSELEIETLLKLIEHHGISYTRIKKEDALDQSILEDRDQVAIKDKVRNMKMDYLKGGRYLPPNFEKIPLSRPLVGRLAAAGIDYDPESGHRRDGYWNRSEESDDDED